MNARAPVELINWDLKVNIVGIIDHELLTNLIIINITLVWFRVKFLKWVRNLFKCKYKIYLDIID